jgi:homogentisate phytyltransferase/homogentisate geranylgeranyltransferase
LLLFWILMQTISSKTGLFLMLLESITNKRPVSVRKVINLFTVLISAFIRFSRPHTIIATTLQVVGLFIIAGGVESNTAEKWPVLLLTLVSCLAVNIYIVGLNQLADIEIDRINKPYLPLASAAFTINQGRWIVGLAGVTALLLGASQGLYLFLTISVSFLVGTIYSLPPLHLKRFPVGAALSIAFVRGFVSNVGLYLHFHRLLAEETAVPWFFVLAVALFFFGFGLVIALYKDIPDLAGDSQFGIRTFTVRLGPERVFGIGRWLLTLFYLLPVGLALSDVGRPANLSLVVAHLLALFFFWRASLLVQPANGPSMTRFYLTLWGLFYAEYVFLSLRQIVS